MRKTLGGIAILHSMFFSRTGRYHSNQGMQNEDYCQIRNAEHLTIAVLADGAGCFEAGQIAAQLLVPEVVEWLASTFLEQYYCESMTVRARLVHLITKLFRNYAEEHSIDPKELACTLIAVAVDSQGRGLVLHLGDGIILRQRDQDGCCSVVSTPENGLTVNATYLTMNCNMFEHCRFYRLQETGPFRLLAMTDGAAAHLVDRRGKDGWVYTAPCCLESDDILKFLEEIKPIDDYSVAILKYCP